MKRQAKLKPFFGAWVVETNGVLFPKMFTNKKEAQQIVNHINKKGTTK
jgi:hypothetical protein